MAIVCECLGISALRAGHRRGQAGRGAAHGKLARWPRPTAARHHHAARQNAIAVVAATAGRRRGVRLLAIAREAGVELSLADFNRISAATPLIAESQAVGPLCRHRAACSRRHVTRRQAVQWNRSSTAALLPSQAEEATDSSETPGQEVVRPNDRPLKPTGGLVILFGNLAPEGAVLKLSAPNAPGRRTARVFDSEEQAFEAVQRQAIAAGDVVVIRYEGPSERHAACARCSV